jgi:hypothetical protein
MGYYEAIPVIVEAIQYDGKNIQAVKDILTHQEPEDHVTVTGTSAVFLRTSDRPDRPLLPGDWLTLGPGNWVAIMSNDAFQRRMRPLTR